MGAENKVMHKDTGSHSFHGKAKHAESRNTLIVRAKLFATEKHKHHKRKGSEILYITHPAKVVHILQRVTDDKEIIAAGWLHDVVEDQGVSLDEITRLFGGRVARLVAEVSEQDRALPWAERKRLARERVQSMPKDALLLKSADMLANTHDIIRQYQREGVGMFAYFNAGKDDQRRDKEALLAAMATRWQDNPLLSDLTPAVQTLSRLLA